MAINIDPKVFYEMGANHFAEASKLGTNLLQQAKDQGQFQNQQGQLAVQQGQLASEDAYRKGTLAQGANELDLNKQKFADDQKVHQAAIEEHQATMEQTKVETQTKQFLLDYYKKLPPEVGGALATGKLDPSKQQELWAHFVTTAQQEAMKQAKGDPKKATRFFNAAIAQGQPYFPALGGGLMSAQAPTTGGSGLPTMTPEETAALQAYAASLQAPKK